jgi:hypothetical protein
MPQVAWPLHQLELWKSALMHVPPPTSEFGVKRAWIGTMRRDERVPCGVIAKGAGGLVTHLRCSFL